MNRAAAIILGSMCLPLVPAADAEGQVLTGHVVRAESDIPLSGARVYLEGLSVWQLSDENGAFILAIPQDLAQVGDTVILVAQRIDSQDYREPILIEGDTTRVEVPLREGVIIMGGIDEGRIHGRAAGAIVSLIGTEDASTAARQRAAESLLLHSRYTLWWQFGSSVLIFVIVHGIVGFGLYWSWRHFREASEATGRVVDGQTTIEASLEGIKISSRMAGIIVLVISIAFFYLYLRFVYPITEIGPGV